MLRKTQPRGSVSILRKTQFGCTALFVVLQKEEKPKSKTKIGQKERMSKGPTIDPDSGGSLRYLYEY